MVYVTVRHIFVDFVALLLWNWMMSAYDFEVFLNCLHTNSGT